MTQKVCERHKCHHQIMKITVEVNDESLVLDLHNDNTIWDMIQKIRILLTFCGYSQDLINQIIEEHE